MRWQSLLAATSTSPLALMTFVSTTKTATFLGEITDVFEDTFTEKSKKASLSRYRWRGARPCGRRRKQSLRRLFGDRLGSHRDGARPGRESAAPFRLRIVFLVSTAIAASPDPAIDGVYLSEQFNGPTDGSRVLQIDFPPAGPLVFPAALQRQPARQHQSHPPRRSQPRGQSDHRPLPVRRSQKLSKPKTASKARTPKPLPRATRSASTSSSMMPASRPRSCPETSTAAG